MFSGAKYIVFDDAGHKRPMLFPRSIEHGKFAGFMPDWYEPVSAGFVTSGLECFGESRSLGLKSREGDTKLVRDMFKSDSQLSMERMEDSLYDSVEDSDVTSLNENDEENNE